MPLSCSDSFLPVRRGRGGCFLLAWAPALSAPPFLTPLAAESSESFVVMAATESARPLVCLSESDPGLSEPLPLLVAMAGGAAGPVKERVAGGAVRSAHQHQRDPGQPGTATLGLSHGLRDRTQRLESAGYRWTS